MHIIQAIILGIIEGLTEFLPVSSTGHLIVAEKAVGFHDYQDLFTVVVQVGAIAAVIWFYRHDLIAKTIGLFERQPKAINFWKILVIGTIPAGLLGLAFEKAMERVTTPLVVALSLIAGGIVLWLVDRSQVKVRRKPEVDLEKITNRQAWLIGLGQCAALIPGVSRSGATIVSGLWSGLDRATATAFSFYLSIPVLVLASGLKLVKYHSDLGQITGGAVTLIVGLICAFVTALAAVAWFLRYVSRHNFQLFVVYRISFGILILLLLGVL